MASWLTRIPIAGSLLVVFAVAVGASGQTQPAQKPVPKIKRVAVVQPIASVEGKDNFEAYCAVCHGTDAKGTGPAAPAMKAVVPDLTTIAKRNNGKFSAVNIEQVIRGTGKTATPAHGVEDMPIWGDVFRHEDRTKTMMRINNLVKYLESIQVPAGSTPH